MYLEAEETSTDSRQKRPWLWRPVWPSRINWSRWKSVLFGGLYRAHCSTRMATILFLPHCQGASPDPDASSLLRLGRGAKLYGSMLLVRRPSRRQILLRSV